MFKESFAFSLFFLLFERIYSLSREEELVYLTYANYDVKYIFLGASILFIGIVEHLLKSYEIITSCGVFCVLAGILWGVGALYDDRMIITALTVQTDTILSSLSDIFIPLTLYSTAFSLDFHSFIKSLPQILIISGPVSIVTAGLIGIIMKLMIGNTWELTDTMLFGVIVGIVYPTDVLSSFKESSVQTKYITSLLYGETLLATTVAVYGHDQIISYTTGWVVHWYQFIANILRSVLLGIPLGYLFGLASASLMKFSSTNAPLLILLTLASCYTSFFITKWLVNGGLFGTILTGILMGMEHRALPQDVQEILQTVWKVLPYITNGVLFIIMGLRVPEAMTKEIVVKDYILCLVTYFVCNISRFISFALFWPFLGRVGYGMSFQNLVICVWCGLKNPICLTLLLEMQVHNYIDDSKKKRIFFLHVMAVFIFMLLINGNLVPFLLRVLGLSEISMSRQVNMNNCMRYIYESRARTVAILKMDRFLSDANWPLVLNSTLLKHPYKKLKLIEEEEGYEDDEDLFVDYRFTYCPDCRKNVPNEPTPKEMREMIKEAKLRVLKLKKIAYSRQYEYGMISKDGVRALHQAVEIAMDSEQAAIELDGLLEMFTKESYVYKRLQNYLQNLLEIRNEKYKLPINKYRARCNLILHDPLYFFIISIVILSNFIYVIVKIALELHEKIADMYIRTANIFFFLVYFAEFLLKIFGYSWVHICSDGFKIYFTSFWNILEFLILCCTFVKSIDYFIIIDETQLSQHIYVDIAWVVLLTLKIFRIPSYLKIFQFPNRVSSAVFKYTDSKINRHKILAYELGTNYVTGEEEILQNLPQIVDNEKIRKKMKEKTEYDQHIISRRLGLLQKEKPLIASIVKTKAAIRTVLNSIKNDIYELKVSGWVDDLEYNKLLISLSERCKYLQNIKFVPPPSPKLIFQAVAYMGDDEELINFLYSNVTTKKFDPGDIVIKEDDVGGIYILITGMFLVSYIPNETILNVLKENGALPTIDYLYSSSYDEPASEYFMPGNTIGELSTITGRSYNGEVIAETYSEVYFLSRDIIKKASEMDSDPVNGFESRIWKTVAFKIAVDIMMGIVFYRSYTREKIKYLIERSFVPNLSNYKIFVVNEMMQDIILIEGVVIDFNTRDIYTAPCYIPRAVQKLVLPKSSFIDLPGTIETKLMIVPAKDFDAYEIMISEEEMCQLVERDRKKSLLQMIKDSSQLTPESSKQHNEMSGVAKHMRKELMKVESTKSKIKFVLRQNFFFS